MQMDAKDVAQLVNKTNRPADPQADSSVDMQIVEIQANVLPDVYPDDDKKR